MQEMNSSGGRLRRSAVGNIERARSRTLKMTLVIGRYTTKLQNTKKHNDIEIIKLLLTLKVHGCTEHF